MWSSLLRIMKNSTAFTNCCTFPIVAFIQRQYCFFWWDQWATLSGGLKIRSRGKTKICDFFYLSYKPFLSPIFCLPSLISSQAVLYLSMIRKDFKRQWSNIYTPLEEGLFQFYALEWSGEWKHLSEVCPVHQSCTGSPPDGETDNCSWFRF